MLDPDFSGGFSYAHAAELARLAELAYAPTQDVLVQALLFGYHACHAIDNPSTDTAAIALADEKNVVVAFRGTRNIRDALTDGACCKDAFPGGEVHRGFRTALGSIAAELLDAVRDLGAGKALWVTGHSLGGSLALLAAGEAAMRIDRAIHGVYAFAPARPGDRAWRAAYDAVLRDATWCVVRDSDVVPRLPPRSFGYSHVGQVGLLSAGEVHFEGPAWKNKLNVEVDRASIWGGDGLLANHAIADYRRDLEALLQPSVAAPAAGSETVPP